MTKRNCLRIEGLNGLNLSFRDVIDSALKRCRSTSGEAERLVLMHC